MSIPDLGIDFDRLTSELGSDLGDVFGKVAAQARGGLERVANAAQSTGTGLERIAATGGGGANGIARIAAMGGGGGNTLGSIAAYGGGGNTLDSIIGYGGGGGNSLDFFSTLGGSNPFAAFEQAQYANAAQAPVDEAAIAAAGAAPRGGATGGTGGSYDSDRDKFEMYRAHIQKYAAAEGIDADALAAMLWIETDGGAGGATAVSPAGARGLGQVMPGTWAGLAGPGEDPFNPEHSIKAAAKYFADQYRRFGSYDLAAAAYQGGPGAIVNGRARTDVSDGNMTPAQYAAQWKANYDRIRSTAPAQGARPNGQAVDPNGYSFPVVDYKGTIQLHHGSHAGAADIFAAAGTAVVAMRGGKVTSAGYDETGGNYVTIEGDDGNQYYYAHLQSLPAVRAGQAVGAGVLIGQVGDTGNARGTGAHLHIGIGPSILSGTGPAGGAGGGGFNATALLQQVYQNQYAR